MGAICLLGYVRPSKKVRRRPCLQNRSHHILFPGKGQKHRPGLPKRLLTHTTGQTKKNYFSFAMIEIIAKIFGYGLIVFALFVCWVAFDTCVLHNDDID